MLLYIMLEIRWKRSVFYLQLKLFIRSISTEEINFEI
jgi:hypothetical protein